MKRLSVKQIRWIKLMLHLAAFIPLVWLIFATTQGLLGVDPGKALQHFTGLTTLKMLLATLLISPLSRYLRQPLLIRTRRLLGIWCFVWGTLHLLCYYLLELGISNLALLGEELINRPYLTIGISGWLIMMILTLTSPQIMQRKLARHWQRLHNLVYLIVILGAIHYIWAVKIISPQPVIYALVILLLLLTRYKKFRSWVK